MFAVCCSSLVMEIVTLLNPTKCDDCRLPPHFSSLFQGIRHFWSSLVVTFGRHFSPHIKNIFGKMFRTCRNYRPFVATIAPLSRGSSGVVRRPEGEGVRFPRVVTGRHLSSLGRHWSSPVVTFWASPVVTGRHFWSSQAHSKFIKIHKRSASLLRCSIAAAIQHRRCDSASPLRCSIGCRQRRQPN